MSFTYSGFGEHAEAEQCEDLNRGLLPADKLGFDFL